MLFATYLGFAQVGIGTTDPQAELDVNGSLLVQAEVNVGTLPTVVHADEDFKLLTRLTNSEPLGELTVLNVDSLTVAPINLINYRFNNINLDNLTDVDLQYDATKYIVGVANFRYIGDAIKKTPINGKKSIGAFVVRTFVKSGNWHLEIRNRFLDLEANTPNGIQYHVTLIVYDKSYFKNLPPITTNLNGSQTGVASAIPNL